MAERTQEDLSLLGVGGVVPGTWPRADDSRQSNGGAADNRVGAPRLYQSIVLTPSNGKPGRPATNMSMDAPTAQQRKGCFLDRCKAFVLVVAFVASVVIVGLLAFYLHKPPDCNNLPIVVDSSGTSNGSKSTDHNAVIENTTLSGIDTQHLPVRPNVRLPRDLVPSSYDLELQPYMESLTYDGKVSILMDCMETTKIVTLHLLNLNVNDMSLQDTSGNHVKITGHTLDHRLQFLVINLDSDLTSGNSYNLTIRFNGTLHSNLDGFYWVKYKENGKDMHMATTQFEAVSARSAFPCFDEPAFKAVFNITLVRWDNMTSISNMPLLRKENREPPFMADVYQSSPKMSTYLLAFVVSNLGSMTTDNLDIKMQVWARPEIINSAYYAGTIAPLILNHYEEFFGIPYPLKKTDLVAAPDFNAGAMENWGLIIFRENSMLFDDSTTPVSTKKKVAQTVAHELAHQWFGNLVTPKWWDDLWLNEGFASYMEYLGTTFVEPTWAMEKQFVVDYNHDVMDLDALKTSHPVSVPVYDPDEINEIFDLVSYEKGAAVVRMMDKFLGDDVFMKGLRSYLQSKQYDNAETAELWTHLTNAQSQNDTNRINVATVMDTWTKQTGFPLVTVTRNYDNNNSVIVSQKRFLLQKSNDSADMDVLWYVPLTWADNSTDPDSWNTKVQRWLNTTSDTFILPNISNDAWVIFNNQETGFYRVNYDNKNWEMIISQLQADHSKIHDVNRAQILNDAFALARTREISYSLALNTTSYLATEDDYIPWTAALTSMSFLNTMLSRSDIYGTYKKYILKLVQRQYTKLGWTEASSESILTQFHRVEILQWACSYGHPDCVSNAKALFLAWMNNSQSVRPNLRRTVYCTGVAYGTEDDWNYVWQRYLNESSPSEKNLLLKSLSCSREPSILVKLLNLALNPDQGIRLQDSVTAITLVANTYGREIYFNFVRNQYDRIFNMIGSLTFSLSYVIDRLGEILNTPFELQEMKEFAQSSNKKMGTAKRSFNQAIESVEANTHFMKDNYNDIRAWLESNAAQ